MQVIEAQKHFLMIILIQRRKKKYTCPHSPSSMFCQNSYSHFGNFFFPTKIGKSNEFLKISFRFGHLTDLLFQEFSPSILLRHFPTYRKVQRILYRTPRSTTKILPLTFYYTCFIEYLSILCSSISFSGAFQNRRYWYRPFSLCIIYWRPILVYSSFTDLKGNIQIMKCIHLKCTV